MPEYIVTVPIYALVNVTVGADDPEEAVAEARYQVERVGVEELDSDHFGTVTLYLDNHTGESWEVEDTETQETVEVSFTASGRPRIEARYWNDTEV